ncbi:carbohydrate ABC transporter permease [Paenibacillus humicola]|uniref:carbohydrate ABC transporter permease n=1 Tax=Paenibacillus humicola TaxID=3110540 RepID=UPI00237A1AB8|nr:sugar ABC transporter permease [Paenibacillus humicola]
MIKVSRLTPYLFLAPFLLLFLMFFLYPLGYSLYLSLFVSRMGGNLYVGLHNFAQVFHDPNFWGSLKTIFYFGIVQVDLGMLVSIALALLLDSPYVKGKDWFRLIYFLPYAVPGVIAALMWGFLYSPDLDPALRLLGGMNGGHPVDLLSADHLLYAIVNMVIWQWTGYTMTIYLAGLTSVPPDIYEAAKIDGCSEWKLAWRMKLPLLRPTIVLNSVLAIIGTLQLFNEPFVLTSLTTVPYNFTPNMDIYNTAFSYNNFNYSAAMSIVLALLTIGASLLFMFLATGNQRGMPREGKAGKRAAKKAVAK